MSIAVKSGLPSLGSTEGAVISADEVSVSEDGSATASVGEDLPRGKSAYEIAKENGVQGRVTLQFTVNPDGSVSNVKVLRGVDPSLDKEAVRVVSASPKWKPGKQRDRAVKVTYTFQVYFQLK
mgnify:CR=1 FL=1